MFLVKFVIIRENSFQKKEELVFHSQNSSFSLGAGTAFPSIVALIPMGENADTRAVLKQIIDMSSDCDIRYSSLGFVIFISQNNIQEGIAQPVTVVLPKHKSRLTFVCCTQSLETILDTVKVADLCVFVANVANGEEMVINQQADLILTSLRSQGLPTCIGLTQGLEFVQNAKSKTNLKKYATRYLFLSLYYYQFIPE